MTAAINWGLLHNLDHLRHFFAFAFNPDNWITNGSEQIIAIVIGVALWPKVKPRVEGWIKELHHVAIEEHEEWRHREKKGIT